MATLPEPFRTLDNRITSWMAKHGVLLARLSLGLVFFWFGVLKFFPGLSPAEDLASRTLERLSFGQVQRRRPVLVPGVGVGAGGDEGLEGCQVGVGGGQVQGGPAQVGALVTGPRVGLEDGLNLLAAAQAGGVVEQRLHRIALADEAMDLTGADLEIHVVQCAHTREVHHQPASRENRACLSRAHDQSAARIWRLRRNGARVRSQSASLVLPALEHFGRHLALIVDAFLGLDALGD